MKSCIADLDMLARGIANAGEQLISNEPMAFYERIVVPDVQSERSATRSEQRDRAVPKWQVIEDRRIVEANVKRKNHGPRKPKPSIPDHRTPLVHEARVFRKRIFGAPSCEQASPHKGRVPSG